MDRENQRIQQIQEQIHQLRDEIAVERGRINSLWWKFGILAGIIGGITAKVFGSTFGAVYDMLFGWWI